MTKQRTRRTRVGSSDDFFPLGVHAPSIVKVRDKNAERAFALSQALGLAANIFGGVAERRHDKAVLKGTEAAIEGRELTPEEQLNDSFMLAYEGIQTERSWTDFVHRIDAEYPEARTAENFDAGTWLDEQARLQFDGLDPEVDLDAETARFLMPRLQQFRANLLEVEQETTFEEAKTEAGASLLAVAAGIRDVASLTAEHWQEFNRNALDVSRRDPAYADDIASTIIEQAAAAGDVESLDAMPTTWASGAPTIRGNAETATWFENQLEAAKRVQHERIEIQSTAAVGVARAQLEQLAESGDPSFTTALEAATEPNEYGIRVLDTPAQVATLTNKYLDTLAEREGARTDLGLWAVGNARALPNAQKEVAAENYVTSLAEQGVPPEAIRAALVERSVVNNHVPQILRNELDVSPSNPAAYAQAVQLFEQFEAQQPGFIAQSLSADQVRDFSQFRREVVRQGGDIEAAAEALTKVDHDLVQAVPAGDRREARDEVLDVLGDGPLWRTLVRDTPVVRKLIDEELEYHIAHGRSLEDAVRLTTEALHPRNGRYVAVRGYLYKPTAGWGADPEAVADYAAEVYAKELDIDPDDVAIEPVPGKPGRVRVVDQDNSLLTGGMTEYPIADLTAEWLTVREQENLEAAQRGRDEARERAERLARPRTHRGRRRPGTQR